MKVKLDFTQDKEPISPYIYGQFIEHLGRCIYGGIWAEMIEDRKFYYPIKDDFNPWGTKTDEFWKAGEFPVLIASPWQIVGPEGSVEMRTSDPYVGDHDPVITVQNGMEAGIKQGGFILLKDKSYSGRIVVAAEPGIEKIVVKVSEAHDAKPIEQIIFEVEKADKQFKAYPFEFEANQKMENATLQILGMGKGKFTIGTISLMPADNIHGFRADVIELLKELNSPIYRWPGGNFVSGYNWKDGVGERDKRPPRKNPAWTGIEHNDVGIDEFMAFCKLIDTEPFIAVNTGLGTVDEVVEELQYCNGDVDTPMGKWRLDNGHQKSYEVKYWAVGNEMYGDWQLGHMPLSEYVQKHNAMADAMWAVDAEIQLVGVGNVGEWSEAMLRECSDHMDLISEHIYEQEKKNVIAHARMIPDAIRAKAKAHRNYRDQIPGLDGKDIKIAMDEWNHWYGDYIYGELGVRYYFKDALGIAAGLHEYFRNSDIYYMANYAQTVNVIGAIKTTQTEAEFATTGMVLKLYRNHFGVRPIALSCDSDTLDIFAAWSENEQIFTLAVVNPSIKEFNLKLEEFPDGVSRNGVGYILSADDPLAYNAPGESKSVDIHHKKLDTQSLVIAPMSISLYKFEKEG